MAIVSSGEKKYSQIDKEALELIHDLKKFHQYFWGRHFTLVTDHRPLLTLFADHKSLPTLAAASIQHWAAMTSTLSTGSQKNTVMLMDSPIALCLNPAT